MKRFITLIVLAVVSVAVSAKGSGVSSTELLTIINDYRDSRGIEFVKVGTFGTGTLKSMIKISLKAKRGKEADDIIKAIGGIRKYTLVDFSNCNRQVRSEMSRRLGNALDNSELLIEFRENDEDDTGLLRMYGVVDDDAATIKNFILYDEVGFSIICLFGTISLDGIARK